MRVSAIFLIGLIAFSSAAFAKRQVRDEQTTENALIYAFQGLRGSYLGFNDGAYGKQGSVECLNDATAAKIIKILSVFNFQNGDMSGMMNIFGDVMEIFADVQSCSISVFSDLGDYCYTSGACTLPTMMVNIQKNMF